ncbi:hypothetical protein G7Y89_g7701 [Cudoniella acicularis]|uniref:Uncharacterized protein n=1 Tax=Cudoniella acicularis TaxID=354080 RepID=A0A8H4RJZ5_9HELO|nr:hypothetical protein G7Y89_g7701 [Cudoniella acicularis]
MLTVMLNQILTSALRCPAPPASIALYCPVSDSTRSQIEDTIRTVSRRWLKPPRPRNKAKMALFGLKQHSREILALDLTSVKPPRLSRHTAPVLAGAGSGK